MNTKKHWILTVLLVGIFTTVLGTKALGQGTEKDKLGITFTTRVVSEYIWRGFDKFDDRGAVQPSINLDWFGSGFSTMVWGSISSSSSSDDFENDEEARYIVAYSGSFWEDAPYATYYSANWIYYDFPNTFSMHKDAQEGGVGFSWPGFFVLGEYPLVPSYYVGNLWAAKSNALNRQDGGWIHILGLGYDFPVFGLMVEKQTIHLASEIVYNDGMGRGNVDNDWSHVVLGISSSVQNNDVTVRAELNYQISMETTVNDEDELWSGLSISYNF